MRVFAYGVSSDAGTSILIDKNNEQFDTRCYNVESLKYIYAESKEYEQQTG